jgi:hypothetical protein
VSVPSDIVLGDAASVQTVTGQSTFLLRGNQLHPITAGRFDEFRRLFVVARDAAVVPIVVRVFEGPQLWLETGWLDSNRNDRVVLFRSILNWRLDGWTSSENILLLDEGVGCASPAAIAKEANGALASAWLSRNERSLLRAAIKKDRTRGEWEISADSRNVRMSYG